MNNKISRLGFLFVAVGFVCILSFVLHHNFTGDQIEYLINLGMFSMVTGLLILACCYVIYAFQRVFGRWLKK